MSDLAGGALVLKSPLEPADDRVFFELLKVAIDHGLFVAFAGNLVQDTIREMIDIPVGDEVIPFLLSASPLENTAETLVRPDPFLVHGDPRRDAIRRSLGAIRSFLQAAFESGRVSTALLVFSDANATAEDFADGSTTLEGFVDVCFGHIVKDEHALASLRIWVTEARKGT